MNITLTLTEGELQDIIFESPMARSVFVRILGSAQSALSQKVEPTEEQLVEQLKTYVRANFSNSSKIAGIKYVRQWAFDNKNKLSSSTYESLFPLANAKHFVEDLIRF